MILTAPAPTDVWENLKSKHQTTDVPVVISSEEFSCQKAIYFPPNTLLADVLREFVRRSLQPVSAWLYSLYYQTDDNSEVALLASAQVGSLPPGNPVRMIDFQTHFITLL